MQFDCYCTGAGLRRWFNVDAYHKMHPFCSDESSTDEEEEKEEEDESISFIAPEETSISVKPGNGDFI